ncbi:MAG: hypothetical protein MUC62_09445 [Candidatus Thermoplasmatota archaeon]|nr:hypothetical protein [Candidatus Thermoplasmatota archaeon]
MRSFIPLWTFGTVFLMLFMFPIIPAEADAPSGWGAPELIETENEGNAVEPRIDMDDEGNVMAVWLQHDGVRDNILANRYSKEDGWGIPQLIERTNEDVDDPHVGMDRYGNAIAIWKQYDGARYNVWSNRYTYGTGWGQPELVETNNAGTVYVPYIDIGRSGIAIVVWCLLEGTGYRVWSNTYVPGEGWGTDKPLENGLVATPIPPRVAVDSNGNAIAAWPKTDGVRTNIWYNLFTPSGGWGDEALLETDDKGDAGVTAIAFDRSGNAIVAWPQSDGIRANIWYNLYSPSGGWAGAALLESEDLGDALGPDIEFDASGNAMAVWYQSDGMRTNIRYRFYAPGVGWGAPAVLEKNDLGDAKRPSVAIAPDGFAVAVWHQSDGTLFNVWSNSFLPGVGWGVPELIEQENAGNGEEPLIVMEGSGNAIVVWEHNDGKRTNIMSIRFVRPDINPPLLSLLTPNDGLTSETAILTVSGTTEPGVSLEINGLSATVAPDGSFSCGVPLGNGSNRIIVTATDRSGNTVSVVRNVTYDDGMMTINSKIDLLEVEVEEVAGSINRIRADILHLEEQVNALGLPLNGTETNLTGLLENISRLGSLLDGQMENLSYLSGALATLERTSGKNVENISSIRERLDDIEANINVSKRDIGWLLDRIDATRGQSDDLEEELDATKEDLDTLKVVNKVLFFLLVVNMVLTIVIIFVLLNSLLNRKRRTTGPDDLEE